jgi:iron complex transport system permease protein
MRKILLIVALAALAFALVAPAADDAADEENWLLLDMGNGITYWVPASGTDAVSMAEAAAASLGLEFEKSGSGIVTIGDMTEHSVGTQTCSWHLYVWKNENWMETEQTSYSTGSIAWGFYPDKLFPVETPEFRSSWIQFRGDSMSSGVSSSVGTDTVETPLEWYKTYRTGYVDSSIIVAQDLLYHTTYGETSTEGSRSHAYLYCVNRLTSEMQWKFDLSTGNGVYPDLKDFGYNITSPVIVGDMVVINSATNHDSNGKIVMDTYLIDRFTGELIDYEEILHDPPTDEYKNPVWKGRTFLTGGTSPVYDSGAIYFGTSDGRLLAYSVSRDNGFELLWEYIPSSDIVDDKYVGSRGSMYYYSPIIVEVEGERILFMSNYEGYVIAVNASTGEKYWEKQLIALYEKNKSIRNTPGATDLITYIGNNKIVVTCLDGAMVPLMGYTVCVDTRTGEGADGQPFYWRIDGVCQGTVPVDGDFILYAKKASVRSTPEGEPTILEDGLYRMDENGNTVWYVKSNYIWSRLTYAAGLVYASEYSAGIYDDGGHVFAFSAENGSTIWSVKLEPYSNNSYSMAAPTVVDGKIYAANDYGAIYCISTVKGKKWDGGGEIILPGGFWHWSWALLIAIAILAVIALVRFY